VPFTGLWLDAPLEVRAQRVEQREGDASDADAAVVRLQADRDVGPIHWARVDAALSTAATRDHARAVLDVQPV
jgi:predicted kinase